MAHARHNPGDQDLNGATQSGQAKVCTLKYAAYFLWEEGLHLWASVGPRRPLGLK